MSNLKTSEIHSEKINGHYQRIFKVYEGNEISACFRESALRSQENADVHSLGLLFAESESRACFLGRASGVDVRTTCIF